MTDGFIFLNNTNIITHKVRQNNCKKCQISYIMPVHNNQKSVLQKSSTQFLTLFKQQEACKSSHKAANNAFHIVIIHNARNGISRITLFKGAADKSRQILFFDEIKG